MDHTILAIHAHPDDIEFLAAGTLAGLAREGHRVVLATMTAGDCGTVNQEADEIAKIRVQEAANSAALIKARYFYLGFRDMAVFSDHPSRQRLTEFLRAIRPTIVVTSSPEDYMADHEATALLVRDACFAAALPNYSTGESAAAMPLAEIPALYFMDPIGGVDRYGTEVVPHFVVDIEKTFDLKIAMLMEHKSQREWLRIRHGLENYVSNMQKWTRQRGALAGIRIGEGFRHYKGHPYPQDPRLESLVEKLLHRPLVRESEAFDPSLATPMISALADRSEMPTEQTKPVSRSRKRSYSFVRQVTRRIP
ncbi:MAG: PIG-L family deacetylase [Bryobacterales bacterium]|nr:PIG-L family deacetylase [Bryobacterales bacterium]